MVLSTQPRWLVRSFAWAFSAFVAVTLTVFGGAAAAQISGTPPRVYLDGLPLGANQHVKYSHVDVEIVADGSVHITTRRDTARTVLEASSPSAPADGVQPRDDSNPSGDTSVGIVDERILETQQATNTAVPTVTGRYWLVTQDKGDQPAGWSVEVSINGRSAGRFVAGDPKVVEVTSFLRNGDNSARVEFHRTGTSSATEGPASRLFQVLIAPGRIAEDLDEIALGYPIILQERNASQSDATAASRETLQFVLPPPILP